MKLYLSSYKIGNQSELLKKWIESQNNKICLIINSRDVYPDGERKTLGLQNDVKDLENLGFKVTLLDLRNYFGKKDELEKIFQENQAFYAVGGNAFVLRKAMKLSGFDELLEQYADNPNYLYSGYSAGICLLSKDMSGLAIMDDPEADPYDSGLPPIYDGIGFINEAIIPHFESDHKETELATKAVNFCQENNLPFIALHDGDVIVEEIINHKLSR